ncbi:hypothetical protein [Spongiivirga citrea]|uniref:Uncharacterized protein n=1 Tax=Spongiivirga citrea TaxID=1481457 RepID=A0A6M0CIS7_9FLAO|nr:hypothetical protein [Spongiivirga citrea]NER15849.1 hypothetical protein [Spongiivirga citrea]
MKKLNRIIPLLGIFFLISSCSTEEAASVNDTFNNVHSLEYNSGAVIVNSCKPEPISLCGGVNYVFWGLGTFWGGYNPDHNQLTYTEYEDGSVNITGSFNDNAGKQCTTTVDVWLINPKSYADWSSGGGMAHIPDNTCSNVNPEDLTYYLLDETRSILEVSGCIDGYEDRNGAYDVLHSPTDLSKGFQIGNGGSLFDEGSNLGLSGWMKLVHQDSGETWDSDFNFLIPCEPEKELECETAFARSTDGSNCFIDNGFSRWGWVLGPISEGQYSYEIYAAAGQCDINKGELVGTVDVDYNDGDVNVTYNIDNGYMVDETHTYAGYDMFPTTKKGKATVAPGKYTIEENLSGEIFVIAHAVVCK